jgi:hypothetical protein
VPHLVVSGEPEENTPHISAHEIHRIITQIVSKNPKSILIMLETEEGLEWASAPDSAFLQKGMIIAAHEVVTEGSSK